MARYAAFLRAVNLGATRKAGSAQLRSLFEELGFEVVIFLRSASQVRAIAEHEAFSPAAVEASKGKLQVVLLQRKPGKEQQKDVEALASDDDSLEFRDRELYWLPSGGIRDAALNRGAMEKVLGPTTTRTKGTVELIAEKFFY